MSYICVRSVQILFVKLAQIDFVLLHIDLIKIYVLIRFSNEITLDFGIHKGRLPKAIQNLWKEVIEWVENSEYEIAANYDFECYSEGDTDSDDYVSGILVALKLK